MIHAQVHRAGLGDILGSHGITNIQGEVQQKLDVYANEVLLHCLSLRESIGILASEENEHPVVTNFRSPHANYAVVFDPLDGSSNIDIGVSVGTTFSILRRPAGDDAGDAENWVLQPGYKQIAAGYVIYGSSTILVYSVGNGVHGFTLDPTVGAYVLSHENIRMPEQGKYYSVNEAYYDHFPRPYQEYLTRLRTGQAGRQYASRYIGSLVADFHRTLLKGGVFLYPPLTRQSGRETASAVRSQPGGFSGGTGRRHGDRRPAANPGHPAREDSSTHAAGRRQPRRDGGIPAVHAGRLAGQKPGFSKAGLFRSWLRDRQANRRLHSSVKLVPAVNLRLLTAEKSLRYGRPFATRWCNWQH